jgi:5-methyltetrahydrofolate--homocysteine methyltransferase
MEAVHAANVLAGTDPNCTNWIMKYRDHKPAEPGATAAAAPAPAAGGRRGGRAARAGAGASNA